MGSVVPRVTGLNSDSPKPEEPAVVVEVPRPLNQEAPGVVVEPRSVVPHVEVPKFDVSKGAVVPQFEVVVVVPKPVVVVVPRLVEPKLVSPKSVVVDPKLLVPNPEEVVPVKVPKPSPEEGKAASCTGSGAKSSEGSGTGESEREGERDRERERRGASWAMGGTTWGTGLISVTGGATGR